MAKKAYNVTLSDETISKLKEIKSLNRASRSGSIEIAVEQYYNKLINNIKKEN